MSKKRIVRPKYEPGMSLISTRNLAVCALPALTGTTHMHVRVANPTSPWSRWDYKEVPRKTFIAKHFTAKKWRGQDPEAIVEEHMAETESAHAECKRFLTPRMWRPKKVKSGTVVKLVRQTRKMLYETQHTSWNIARLLIVELPSGEKFLTRKEWFETEAQAEARREFEKTVPHAIGYRVTGKRWVICLFQARASKKHKGVKQWKLKETIEEVFVGADIAAMRRFFSRFEEVAEERGLPCLNIKTGWPFTPEWNETWLNPRYDPPTLKPGQLVKTRLPGFIRTYNKDMTLACNNIDFMYSVDSNYHGGKSDYLPLGTNCFVLGYSSDDMVRVLINGTSVNTKRKNLDLADAPVPKLPSDFEESEK